MEEKHNEKKRFLWRKHIITILSLLLGGICGFLIARYALQPSESSDGVFQNIGLYDMILPFAAFLVSFYLQIILHETGHLIGGLLSGYSFSSFRISSFMWIKERGEVHFRRLSVAGTGGQCLMIPPENDTDDRDIPTTLYNMGGSAVNLITGLLALGIYLTSGRTSVMSLTFLMFAVAGIAFALMNGLPLQTTLVNNDGYNAVTLSKSPSARQAFAAQLRLNAYLAQGIRIKDMPSKYFRFPSDEEMKDSQIAVAGILACGRLLDEHRFSEAKEWIMHFLGLECSIAGLHRNMLICDQIYCSLLCREPARTVEQLLTKHQKKFMKTMKKYPSVLRTEYTCALLIENDRRKAEKIKGQFEKISKTYPYPADMQCERELMEIAYDCWEER